MKNKKLCKCGGEGSTNRWYPNSIHDLSKLLETKIVGDEFHNMRKNMSYNLQHLEYLDETIKSLSLSSVILTQNFKIFVIIGMSIVECVFFHMLKTANDCKKDEWKVIRKFNNHFELDGKKMQYCTEIKEKMVDSKIVPMGFDTMVNKIKGRKLLEANEEIYKDLDLLKTLRNKVHIYDAAETDYSIFNKKEYDLMRGFLYQIFTKVIFSCDTDQEMMLGFLKLDNY
jgi:hypothetical protein